MSDRLRPLPISTYEQAAHDAAWFLTLPTDEERYDTIRFGLTEEIDELLGDDKDRPLPELSAALWGYEITADEQRRVTEHATTEAGDVLYFVTGAGILQNISLPEMMHRGLRFYTGKADTTADIFEAFDAALEPYVGTPMSPTYKPDYFWRQFFDFPPFYTTPDYRDGATVGWSHEKIAPDRPVYVDGDGRYALERTLRHTHDLLGESEIMHEQLATTAGIALGALSIILQNRLGTSLANAARNNMAKMNRRRENGTQKAGNDPERSRGTADERPNYTGFEATLTSLVLPEQPTSSD